MSPTRMRNRLPGTDGKLCIFFGEYRSGSTWLAELLLRNGGPDCRDEIFAPARERFLSDGARWNQGEAREAALGALSLASARAVRGSWGFKMMPDDWLFVARALALPEDDIDSFIAHYDRCSIVWTRRRDKLAQAISLWLARESGIWHRYSEDQRPNLERQPDYEEILATHSTCLQDSETWRRLLASSSQYYLAIDYEDAVIDPLRQVRSLLLRVMGRDIHGLEPTIAVPILRSDQGVLMELRVGIDEYTQQSQRGSDDRRQEGESAIFEIQA